VAALEEERNDQGRTITWSFTAYDARTKLRGFYPIPQRYLDGALIARPVGFDGQVGMGLYHQISGTLVS